MIPVVRIQLVRDSAVPGPEMEDRAFTDRLRNACPWLEIELLDHIIVTPDKERWFSFSKEGLL